MQLSTFFLAALAGLASAQEVKTHVVIVAQDGTRTYKPDNLRVAPGEAVQFQFASGNHTVTQSTFDNPCQPISAHSNVTGFHSGFLPVAASAAMGMIPVYTIMVNSTAPIWIYCAQNGHCENGHVMVINEPENPERTLAAYKAKAAEAETVVPGGPAGQGGTTGTTPGGQDGGAGGAGNGGGTGTDDGAGTQTSGTPLPTAGAGMLSAPSLATMAFAAAAAGAAFFL